MGNIRPSSASWSSISRSFSSLIPSSEKSSGHLAPFTVLFLLMMPRTACRILVSFIVFWEIIPMWPTPESSSDSSSPSELLVRSTMGWAGSWGGSMICTELERLLERLQKNKSHSCFREREITIVSGFERDFVFFDDRASLIDLVAVDLESCFVGLYI